MFILRVYYYFTALKCVFLQVEEQYCEKLSQGGFHLYEAKKKKKQLSTLY